MSIARTTHGYTLLEMIVAVALFSIVMLLATGAFVKLMALDRTARYRTDVTNNLTFAVDSMTRAIRTGSNYRCGTWSTASPNCWDGAGGAVFTFDDDQGRVITYRKRTDGSLGRCVYLKGQEQDCSASGAVSITDSRIKIDQLIFRVKSVGSGDMAQPQMLMSLKGSMIPDPDHSAVTFTIQTMATQRLIEL